jgi:hypothetical protein
MVALTAGFSMAISPAAENQGAENIELQGSKNGKVLFPHRRHQKNLADCQICHAIFPQEAGAIEKLKAQGALENKYVMNKLCTKCHREKKKAGQPSGPMICAKCHHK